MIWTSLIFPLIHFFGSDHSEASELAGEQKFDVSACRNLYDTVVAKVLEEMGRRFDGLEEYEYVGLLNQEKFEMFNKSFPTHMIKKTRQTTFIWGIKIMQRANSFVFSRTIPRSKCDQNNIVDCQE